MAGSAYKSSFFSKNGLENRVYQNVFGPSKLEKNSLISFHPLDFGLYQCPF